MKRLFVLLLVCLAVCGYCALAEDAFDISADTQQVEELGIPTVELVQKLKVDADNLWNAKDYKKAAKAYAEYAKKVNWLANLVSAGLDPYYNATSSERKDYYPSDTEMRTSALVKYERKANEYKRERNRAIMREGLCYYNMNDYETALPLLLKALDLFDLNDEVENWKTTMNALYDIVGI
ncbi:MAG: hypothetical protein IJA83_11345 [Clostridia bacterium]|nr:hypothetical protein [Clostridia bacterium]